MCPELGCGPRRSHDPILPLTGSSPVKVFSVGTLCSEAGSFQLIC